MHIVTKISLIVLIFTTFIITPSFSQITEAELDSLSLIAIYNQAGGPDWTNNTGWALRDRPLDQWHGVSINASTRRVTTLNLDDNNLVGTLSDSIGNLTQLGTLFLMDNLSLGGSLPSTIGNLSNLRTFQLWRTGLSGNIPPEITNLANLENLYLADSNFDGPIPTGIQNMVSLQVLSFDGNNLTGPIPPEIGQLANLTQLYLHENQLSGPLPPELGALSDLVTLSLYNNQLGGIIPPDIYNLTNLQYLRIQNNDFEGPIEPAINALAGLSNILIRNNHFDFFPVVSALINLDNLYIENNNLTFRHIEPNIGVASNSFFYSPQADIGQAIDTVLHPGDSFTLFASAGGQNTLYQWKKDGLNITTPSVDSVLVLSDVYFSDDGTYVCEITNTVATDLTLYTNPIHIQVQYPPRQLDSLALVDLYNSTDGANWSTNTNWLSTSDMENWHGVFINVTTRRVTDLQLSNNNLNGTLPASIGNLTELRNLYLAQNNISGAIPAEIGSLVKMYELWLNGNQINQPIPGQIVNLIDLEDLHLENNQIPGMIPHNIGLMNSLEVLALANNQLTGELPSGITSLPNLRSLWLSGNYLDGSLPDSLGNLTSLTNIFIEDNQLEGVIPASIGDCVNLTTINFSENRLSGGVPSTFNNLSNLESLDLQQNRLLDLPDLSPLTSNLTSLYVQNNRLTFEDLEPNMTVVPAANFQYVPQDSVGIEKDTSLTIGASLTIAANVGGMNNSYQWYRNGTSLSAQTSASLTLSSISDTDAGTYYCQVYNTQVPGLDIFTRPVHLSIQGPPTVTTVPATAITTNSATLNGRVNPNGLSTTVIFEYSTDQTTWTTVNADQSPLTGSGEQTVFATISSLSENTIYYFRISATNSQGTTTGAEQSFQTLSLKSPPTVTTGTLSNIGSTSATIGGTVNPNDLPTEPVFFQLADSATYQIDQTLPLQGINDINVTATITDLSADTDYQIRLVAENDSGRTNGQWVNFRTRPPSNEPTVITLAATNILPNSAQLNGRVNSNGLSTSIVFEWGTTSAFGDTIIAVQSPLTSTSEQDVNATVSGLQNGTPYYFRLKAKNSAGTVYGAEQNFTTPYAVPQLNNPADTETNVDILPTFTWNSVSNVTDYWLQVATDASFGNVVIDQVNISATTFTPSTPLNFSTVYYWRVSAYAAGVPANWSNSYSFTTREYPDQIQLDLTATFPVKSSPEQYTPGDYRIVGLPGESNIPLANVFDGTVDEQWVAYWDNGQNTDYFVKFDQSSLFEFRIGRAFWIINNGSWQINQWVSSATLNSQNEAEIPVHTGWNLITNPFDAPVRWTDVQSLNGISEPLHDFSGSFNTTTTMNPYVGYYFFSNSNTAIRIPVSAGLGKPSLAQDDLLWQVQIHLDAGKQKDHSLRLGAALEAADDMDRHDYRKPRAIGEMAVIYFFRPQWDDAYPLFASDVREECGQFETWSFTAHIPCAGTAQLSFPGIRTLPDDYEIYLIDITHSGYMNLREKAVYPFKASPEKTEFELWIGQAEIISEKLKSVVPAEFSLGQNYPNPFNPTTTIPLALPEQSDVTLTVYNLLGQQITTLFQGTLEAGRHYFIWDGKNSQQQAMPTGVYIYQLITSTGVRFAGKMVMMK